MRHKYLKNVSTLKQTTENCTNCKKCIEVCPHSVFGLVEDNVRIVNLDYCIECGACKRNCSFKALDVKVGVGCAYAIVIDMIMKTDTGCS